MSATMLVAVFSFNRGRYLHNVIESIRRHVPSEHEVRIYDDNSTCLLTRAVLSALEYPIYQPGDVPPDTSSDGKRSWGGLAANLQRAYEDAQELGVDYLFAIQDDMQVVRTVDQRFFHICAKIISDPHVVQIKPKFITGMPVDDRTLELHSEVAYYPRHRHHVADTGLAVVARLHEIGWSFLDSRADREEKARRLGAYPVVHRDPFFAHLPWPAPHRVRRLRLYPLGQSSPTIALLFNEQFFRFRDMDEETVERLLSRSIEQVPFELTWLQVEGARPPEPWSRYVLPARDRFRRIVAGYLRS